MANGSHGKAHGREEILDPQLTAPGGTNDQHWNDQPLVPWLFAGLLLVVGWLTGSRRQAIERSQYEQ